MPHASSAPRLSGLDAELLRSVLADGEFFEIQTMRKEMLSTVLDLCLQAGVQARTICLQIIPSFGKSIFELQY